MSVALSFPDFAARWEGWPNTEGWLSVETVAADLVADAANGADERAVVA